MVKRKHIYGILLTSGLALLIVALAGIAVLRSRAFHRYVLAKIVKQASRASGGRMEVGDFQFAWPGLRVDLYRIVLHGAEPASSKPFLEVDHLQVGLKIISLWQHKIDLNEIMLDHPSIHLSVDQHGNSNLPLPPPAAPGSRPTNVFELAVGHFAVNRGELDYNDRHIPLDGEVHDLHAQVNFESLKTAYSGTLDYRDGRIQFGGFNPVQHSIQARFSATASELTLESLLLNAGSSMISVHAQLRDYANPSVDGAYQADLSAGELGKILKARPFPAGQVSLQGTVHYRGRGNHPFLEDIATAGQFRSPVLALNLPQAHANVRGLSGEYRLSEGTLEVRNAQAGVLGGTVSGKLTVAHLSGRPAAQFAAVLRKVSIEAANAALGTTQLQRASISGNLNGTIAGSWEGNGKNLQLHSDATITASAPTPPGAESATNVIPLRGDLHLAYAAAAGVISINHSELTTPHSTVKFDGSTGKQSRLDIQARSDDLREVDEIVLIARNSMVGVQLSSPAPIKPLGIAGSGSFDGQLSGSTTDLHITGRLTAANFQFRDTTLSEFQVNVALSPTGLSLNHGHLRTSDQAQAQFDVDAGLTDWAYTPQSPVRLEVSATDLPVATLEHLANLQYPVSGTLAAHLSMHGSQSNATGQGSVTLRQATAWGLPIENLSVQAQGGPDTIHATIQLQAPAGSGSGKLTYNLRSQSYDVQMALPALKLERLEAVQYKGMQISGVATASLQGQGTLKDPQLTATIQAPQLVIEQQKLDGIKLHAEVAHQKASFVLDSAAVGASIQAQGTVTLNANYPAEAKIDIRNIQLGTLFAAFVPQAPAELQGQAELHGSIRGPLKDWGQLEGEVNIPTLNMAYRSIQIGNSSPIRAVYHGGVVSLEQCELKGTGTNLQVKGAVPLEPGGNLQATATGNIDLHLVQMLYPQWESSGQVRLDISAQGTVGNPDVQGTVRLIDAAFQAPGAPLGAQNVNAELALKNGRIDIQSFSGEAGGGAISAQGFATYRPTVQFNTSLTAKKVRLRYPVGTRAILDGDLVLTGTGDSALLSGRVVVDRLSLTKEFDLSTFADQFTGSSSPSGGSDFAQNIKLNVSLVSASEMALASSKLSVQGSANLTVRGTVDEPVILGRTDITGGEIFFNGNRYVVESGVIQFVNPVRTEPVVNVLVTTTINQFNLSMNFAGPIDRLRTTYSSDPPLAPIDIINLLTTGQTTEAASTSSTSPESVIAGQLTNQLSSRVEKLAGITSLTIDPQVGGAQGNAGGRLAVQQRVTKNLFFTFTTDLRTSTGQVVQVEYQVSRKFAVSSVRDQNGGYTVQMKVHKRF